MTFHGELKPQKRRSLRRNLGLDAGGAVENSFQNAPLGLANPIYNVRLGVSPVLAGLAISHFAMAGFRCSPAENAEKLHP